MKTLKKIVILVSVIFFSSIFCVFAQNTGKKTILLNGGKKGNINFEHHMHQTIINDCLICHSFFPQKSGSLDESKDSGTIKAKQVMNTVCIKCHREMKKAGKHYGPLQCSGCHTK
ncbi:cytochrome c3 family protein [Desulfobacula phenolica]|uniref:Class III cytochrome C family protein n=1 Tax=Desulfobacula phenolica TaxID=90732 RepID=A0A1H2DPY5_9BACT|nr:cytochrome c3 family protein [Desulfobacula phenolica]SDT84952.1 Class III cytochrome C family protein [Desulfobacula phenolica]